jgi:hypothetical protein
LGCAFERLREEAGLDCAFERLREEAGLDCAFERVRDEAGLDCVRPRLREADLVREEDGDGFASAAASPRSPFSTDPAMRPASLAGASDSRAADEITLVNIGGSFLSETVYRSLLRDVPGGASRKRAFAAVVPPWYRLLRPMRPGSPGAGTVRTVGTLLDG